MGDVGVPKSFYTTAPFHQKFTDYIISEANRISTISHTFAPPLTEEILVSNMIKILDILAPRIPENSMHLYTLAGFKEKVKKTDDGKSDRKDYDRVVKRLSRALKRYKERRMNTTAPSTQPSDTPIVLERRSSPPITSIRTSAGSSTTISSISFDNQTHDHPRRIQDDTGSRRGRTNQSTTSRQRRQEGQSLDTDSTATDIFGDPIPRQTSNQAHSNTRYVEKEKKSTELAQKLGSILYDEKRKGTNCIKHLQSFDECADGINRLLGLEVICGDDVKKAIEDNRVGLGSAAEGERRGRPTALPKEEIEDLALLFFSLSSIEQANGRKRLKRPKLISLLSKIVNDKREREGKARLNATHLYKYHIEPLNSLKQDMKPIDKREFIRVLWLTYENLKSNYERWENCCIEWGFA